jgi:HEAT repeat protein
VPESVNERVSKLLKAKHRGDVAYLVAAFADPQIRSMAARCLGQMGATEAIPDLMRLLPAGDPLTRSSAIKALTRLDAREAVPELIEMIRDDPSNTVRTHAVSAVARLAEPSHFAPVFLAALQDPDGGVSTCAAHHLGLNAGTDAIEPLTNARRSHSFIRRGAYTKAIRRIRRRCRRAARAPLLRRMH